MLRRAGLKAEIWICPFTEYWGVGCDAYYVAERCDRYFKDGKEMTDRMGFWLLSGRMEVLTKYQAEKRLDYRKSLGEEIDIVYADALPEGSMWLNVR